MRAVLDPISSTLMNSVGVGLSASTIPACFNHWWPASLCATAAIIPAHSGGAMVGKIFINYRRDDSRGTAGRLNDRLIETFGRNKIFMDVDHIPAGADFVAYLNEQVASSDAFLIVIGPNWLDAKDESGRRRLDDHDDFVAIEIAAALERNIRVIPVLIDGARMPKASELTDRL